MRVELYDKSCGQFAKRLFYIGLFIFWPTSLSLSLSISLAQKYSPSLSHTHPSLNNLSLSLTHTHGPTQFVRPPSQTHTRPSAGIHLVVVFYNVFLLYLFEAQTTHSEYLQDCLVGIYLLNRFLSFWPN